MVGSSFHPTDFTIQGPLHSPLQCSHNELLISAKEPLEFRLRVEGKTSKPQHSGCKMAPKPCISSVLPLTRAHRLLAPLPTEAKCSLEVFPAKSPFSPTTLSLQGLMGQQQEAGGLQAMCCAFCILWKLLYAAFCWKVNYRHHQSTKCVALLVYSVYS